MKVTVILVFVVLLAASRPATATCLNNNQVHAFTVNCCNGSIGTVDACITGFGRCETCASMTVCFTCDVCKSGACKQTPATGTAYLPLPSLMLVSAGSECADPGLRKLEEWVRSHPLGKERQKLAAIVGRRRGL